MKKVVFTFVLLVFGGMMAFAQSKVPKSSSAKPKSHITGKEPIKSGKKKPTGHHTNPLVIDQYSSINGEPVSNKKVKPMKPRKDKKVIHSKRKAAPAK